MITRPLDLASKLRPEPRNFDFLFYVTGGLLVLFFLLFGSRFVLAPGLGVDFQIQHVTGARAGAAQTTHHITVKSSGLIVTENGPADFPEFNRWLQAAAKTTRQPSLLVIASNGVPAGKIAEIMYAANAAGFVKVQWAAEEPMEKN